MNKTITLACLMALSFITLLGQAQKINETAITFLVDATDPTVFNAVENDFNQNLNAFFTNIGIGEIGLGQRLTIRMGVIDESDQLTLKTKSIAWTDKKLSKKEAARQRDPRPLVQMIGSELARCKQLSEKQMTSSPIIDIVLKVFRGEMNTEANEIIVICTDALENSQYANFHKNNVPTTEQEVKKLIAKIDPVLLAEAKEQVASTDPMVIIVLKANDKVKKNAELKKFYNEFFHQIGVNTVRYIDNFSNNPRLP